MEIAEVEGINVVCPISADTVYSRAYQGAFDLVIAQYHDRSHLPIKLIAIDMAGKGIANHANMLSALEYARKLAGH